MSGNYTEPKHRQEQYSAVFSNVSRLAIRISIVLVFAFGFLDFTGWIFNVTFLKSIMPQWTPMKMITSLCLIFAASALLIIHLNSREFLRKVLSVVFAIFICLISLITIYVYSFSIFTGHEPDLTAVPYLNFFISPISRMAFLTACNFLFIGCILYLFSINTTKTSDIAHILAIPLIIISHFIIVSYILGVQSATALNGLPVALNTGIAFYGLSVAVLMMRPDTWLLKIFTSSDTGGIIARKLIIPLMILPIIIGWFRIQGEHINLFESEEGVVLVAITYSVCFLILVWLTAKSLSKIDLKRRASEEALRESENRFRTIAESIPVQISISRISDATLMFTNEAYDKTFGFNKGELIGRKVQDLYFNPEDRKKVIEILKKQGTVDNIELKVKKADGSPFWIISSMQSLTFEGEPSYINAFIDITENKKTKDELLQLNRTLDSLSKSSKSMMHLDNELKYLNEVCKIIIEDCGHSMVWIGYAQNDKNKSVKPVAYSGFDAGYIKKMNITWADTERGRGPTGTAIRTGKPSVCKNMQTDPAFAPWREDAMKRGYASSLVLPLISEGNPFGAISIYSKEPDAFSEREINLLHDLANDLAYGISHIRLIESERRALNAIKESEEKFKLIATNTPDHVLVQDADLRYIYVLNPQLGLTEKDMIGKKDSDFLSKTDAINIARIKEGVLKTGKTEYVNIPLVSPEGDTQYFEGVYVPKHNDKGQIDGIIGYFRNVTRRKEIEEALRESEEQFRLLFDGMTEGFATHEIILDKKGKPCDYRFLSINPAFEKQTGLKAENIIGKKVSEVLPATDEFLIDTYGKVAVTGESIDFETFSPDLSSYFRISAFSPKKGYFAVIFENITSRVLAEKALQSTKNYLENLINNANGPIIVWNPETEIELFNHAFESLTGYSSAEVKGEKLDFLFPKTFLKRSNFKIKRSLTENMQTMKIPILTKNKEIRTVLWNSANIYDTDNKTVLSTIAQGNDITERLKAEQEVRNAKEKLDLALVNANIGIWEWNLKTDEVIWDERMEKMFGLEPGTFGKTFKAFEALLNDEDISHIQKSISKALKNDLPVETIFRTKSDNGKTKYFSSKALVNKDNNKNPVSLAGVCFDITAMREGTEQLVLQLNEELLRSNKELEQFAYVASHDLQEPLRMISSFTQLLSMRYKDKLDNEANEFIQYAVDGALRMQELINDLLEYSRIETRGKKLSVTDMHDVLGHTLINLSLNIKENNALVTSDELPTVMADSGQMIQLFQNLIGNALKFCKTTPLVHISAIEEKDHYLFSVRDNGIGIEPQYFEKIFQIFQRLHMREEYGGTGIGLAICRRIVERHGGKIWVESKPGEGTTFKFTLRKK
jgi:PAS domain S-box-containing protein